MSILTENLMRMSGSGYGGGVGYDPYNIHAALLAEGQTGLQTRRYKEGFEEQKRQFNITSERLQKQLDEAAKETRLRSSLGLAEKGWGTESELGELGSEFGLSYRPQKVGTGTPATGLPGSAGGTTETSMADTLKMYQYTRPYAFQIEGGRLNPSYDPAMAELNRNLAKTIARMGR